MLMFQPDKPIDTRGNAREALSNPVRRNRDAVVIAPELIEYFPLKNGGHHPINLLHVVTGPPARRVK
jgi:hypothetical protein